MLQNDLDLIGNMGTSKNFDRKNNVEQIVWTNMPPAVRRFLEFFAATIRNKNTRQAYYLAVTKFFAWLDAAGIKTLVDIEPLHVAVYVEALHDTVAKPTIKQRLAAIRMLLDWLVTGGILAGNPATSVRGPKHVIKRGNQNGVAESGHHARL
jgi:site-specific recombinase XerD